MYFVEFPVKKLIKLHLIYLNDIGRCNLMEIKYYQRKNNRGRLANYAKFNDIEFIFGGKYFTNFKHGYLHVYIYEFYNGKIEKGYHVHHKDHNRFNNDISNLQLLTHSEHSKIHIKGKKIAFKESNLTEEMLNDYKNFMPLNEFNKKYHPNNHAWIELKNIKRNKITEEMINDIKNGMSLRKFEIKYKGIAGQRIWEKIRNGNY